jgi:hypothetical protein
MVIRKSESAPEVSGNKKKWSSPKKKEYKDYSDWARTDIETVWESKVSEIKKNQRKYFAFLGTVLDGDADKINYFIENVVINYDLLQEMFSITGKISPQKVITLDIIKFVTQDFDGKRSVDNSGLSKRNNKRKSDKVKKSETIENHSFPELKVRFNNISGLHVDMRHTEFISEEKMNSIISKTTLKGT